MVFFVKALLQTKNVILLQGAAVIEPLRLAFTQSHKILNVCSESATSHNIIG